MTNLALPLYMKTIKGDEEVGYALCDMNGEYITQVLNKETATSIMNICNKYYYKKKREAPRRKDKELIGSYILPISAIEKPIGMVVCKAENGDMYVAEPQKGLNYKIRFKKALEESGALAEYTKPIEQRLHIIIIAYCGSKEMRSLSGIVDFTLECMVYSGLIKNMSSRIVVSTDGSRIYHDNEKPRIQILMYSLNDGGMK